MSSETPFKLAIPDADLATLKQKLDLARFPDELDGAGWDYGVPLADIKRLVARWRQGYDWRKHEADINTLPMFTRGIEVDGHGTLEIHYLHQKSRVKNAIPLLFVHGCKSSLFCVLFLPCFGFQWLTLTQGPGIFIEGRKLLPLLIASSPDHPSFHVVQLGLPGYGFSEGPKKKGFAGKEYAQVSSFSTCFRTS